MVTPASAKLEINASNSCNNWFCCCFGWTRGKKTGQPENASGNQKSGEGQVERKPSPVSTTDTETTETITTRVTHVVHTHISKAR